MGLLLLGSYYFYASWKPAYLLLIITITLITFSCARILEKIDRADIRRIVFGSGVALTLSPLFVFKYFDFLNVETADLFAQVGVDYNVPNLNLVLPVAISFFTFQALGYLIDVWRGDTKAERHIGIYALYVSFFPQLVAGPIERSKNLLPQLHNLTTDTNRQHAFNEDRVSSGLKLVLWGFFKKLIAADNLAAFVDIIFADPSEIGGVIIMLAAIAFAFQIYFDFSAYTDIARGVSRILGIELMENFRQPYFATSIPDFWRRWHISLTSWFRDYVYFPLGGNKAGNRRRLINVCIVFLLSGLWHGAAWTFIAWGLVHFILYAVSDFFEGMRAQSGPIQPPSLLGTLYKQAFTFSLVCLAWILFRAQTIGDAGHAFGAIIELIGRLFIWLPLDFIGLVPMNEPIGISLGFNGVYLIDITGYFFIFGVSAVILLIEYLYLQDGAKRKPPPILTFIGVNIALFLVFQAQRFGVNQFIYFQF